jgi:class 3 adenylate cyclase
MDEIDSIKQAMIALEAQRPVLGDAVVDTALAPLREKLASLQPRPAAEQRKLVTVLFADLVGSCLSQHLIPKMSADRHAFYALDDLHRKGAGWWSSALL